MRRISLSLRPVLILASSLVYWSSASPALLSSSDLGHPVSISVTPSFVSGTPSNTHTSTIGRDGKTTSVPIVGGPECWFCPKTNGTSHGEGGWALLGIYGPGVYQPLSSELIEPVPIVKVSLNGDPAYAPSQTSHKSPTKVKRDDVTTSRRTLVGAKLSRLQEAAPKVTEWPVGSFHGVRLKRMTTWHNIPVPDHYWLIAGQITAYDEERDVQCGDHMRRDVTTYMDFVAYRYDIQAPVVDGKPREISFVDRGDDDDRWARATRDNEYFKYLGRMKDGTTHNDIKKMGVDLANEMNEEGYSTLFNNCGTFSRRLWKEIKA